MSSATNQPYSAAVLLHLDRRQESRRFRKLDAFRQWFVALEQMLAADRWRRHGPPEITTATEYR